MGEGFSQHEKESIGAGRPWKDVFDGLVNNGITYWCAGWPAIKVWPGLREFIFRASNIEAKGVVGETETMLAMMNKARAMSRAGVPIDWKSIQMDAEHALPTCQKWCGSISEWVQQYSGGLDAPFVDDLADFDNSFKKTAQRLVGGEYPIADAPLPSALKIYR